MKRKKRVPFDKETLKQMERRKARNRRKKNKPTQAYPSVLFKNKPQRPVPRIKFQRQEGKPTIGELWLQATRRIGRNGAVYYKGNVLPKHYRASHTDKIRGSLLMKRKGAANA